MRVLAGVQSQGEGRREENVNFLVQWRSWAFEMAHRAQPQNSWKKEGLDTFTPPEILQLVF